MMFVGTLMQACTRDEQARSLRLPVLDGGGDTAGIGDFAGRPVLLNVWASWCVACRDEHELLLSLSTAGAVELYGLNYLDDPGDARRWLDYFGDPYRWSMMDVDGKLGRVLGVEVLPATLLIDEAGVVVARHEGPLSMEIYENRFKARLHRQRGQGE